MKIMENGGPGQILGDRRLSPLTEALISRKKHTGALIFAIATATTAAAGRPSSAGTGAARDKPSRLRP
jgi:hypothetical protein